MFCWSNGIIFVVLEGQGFILEFCESRASVTTFTCPVYDYANMRSDFVSCASVLDFSKK